MQIRRTLAAGALSAIAFAGFVGTPAHADTVESAECAALKEAAAEAKQDFLKAQRAFNAGKSAVAKQAKEAREAAREAKAAARKEAKLTKAAGKEAKASKSLGKEAKASDKAARKEARQARNEARDVKAAKERLEGLKLEADGLKDYWHQMKQDRDEACEAEVEDELETGEDTAGDDTAGDDTTGDDTTGETQTGGEGDQA